MKTYYETRYSVDGCTWLRFGERFKSSSDAQQFAQEQANEEIETKVVKLEVEVISRYPKVPGKKHKSIVIPGLGVIA